MTLLIVVVLGLTAVALFGVQPLQGQTTTVTLVKNTGQDVSSFNPEKLDSEYKAWGQLFTTGADATEYRLDSIGIRFGTIHASSNPASELTVTLNNATVVGSAIRPNDDVLCTLTNPATFTSDAVHTFHAPTSGDLCPFLKPNTSYAVVVTRDNANTHEISLPLASGDSEDVLTAPTGWTIHNTPNFFAGPDYPSQAVIGTWVTLASTALMIEVKGNVIAPQLTSAVTAFRVESVGWNAASAYVTVTSPGPVFIRWRPQSETNFGAVRFAGEPSQDGEVAILSYGYMRGFRYVVQASQDESFSDPAQVEFTHEWNNVIRDIQAIEVTHTTVLVEVTVAPSDQQQTVWVFTGFAYPPRIWQQQRLDIPANNSSATTLVENLAMGTKYILDAWDQTPAHRTFFNRFPRESFTTPAPVTLSPDSLNIDEGTSDEYTVVLDNEPTGNVTISIAAGREVTIQPTGAGTGIILAGDALTTQPTSLLFTTTNWNTPQTVTVSAGHDDEDYADDTFTITHTVASGSAAEYAALTVLPDVHVTVRDDDVPPPPAPANLAVITGHGYAALSWESVVDDNPVLRYEVRWRETDGGMFNAWQSVGLVTSHRVEGLTNGTPYEFEVRAVSAHGAGKETAGSGTPTEQVTGIPTAPQVLQVKATDSGRAELSWTRPANANNYDYNTPALQHLVLQLSAIQGYGIEVCQTACDDEANWYELTSTRGIFSTGYVHQVLAPGVIRENHYRVRAININGVAGPWSNVATLDETVVENFRLQTPDDSTLWVRFRVLNPDGNKLYVRYENTGTGTVAYTDYRLTKKEDNVKLVLTGLEADSWYRVDLDFSADFDSARRQSRWHGTARAGETPLTSPYAVDALDAQVFAGGVWRDASDTALYVRMGGTGEYRVRLKPCQGIHDVIVHRIQAPAGRLRASPMETDPVLFTNLNCESEFDDWRRDEHGEPLTMDQVYDMTNFPDRAKDFIPIYAGTPNNWHEVTVTARALEDYPADRRYDALLSAPFAVVYNHAVWKEVTTTSSYLVSDGTGLVRVLVDRPADAVLPVPGGVTIGSDRVMTWDAVSGATGYLVAWRHGLHYSDRANQDRSLQTATSATLPLGGSGRGPITARVRAYSSSGVSAWSAELTWDSRPPTLNVLDTVVHEEYGTVGFLVTLSRPTSEAVTVNYATTDGTAVSPADYTATSGTLTFAPGERLKTVWVLVVDDGEEDSGETFGLVLSNPTGRDANNGAAILGDAEAEATILNTEREVASLTGFTLVDAGTNADLMLLADGSTVELGELLAASYGVRAEMGPGAAPGSVRLELSGARTVTRTDDAAPYSLYGDGAGRVNGQALPPGSYTLRATAYGDSGGRGAALGSLEVSFTVAAGALGVTTPGPFTVAAGETAVAQLAASDTGTSNEASWSIPADAAGGADGAAFAVTSEGMLSLVAAKDFEAPDDADSDGTYEVRVSVTAGTQTATEALSVTLADVDEPALVVMTAGPFKMAEGETAVAALAASDTGPAVKASWSIPAGAEGGADGAAFAVTSEGVLSLVAAKDFEAPDDADGDGTYEVTVAVAVPASSMAGSQSATAALLVTLSDVNEAPVAKATASPESARQGAEVTLDGSASTDPDAGDTLTYLWTQADDGAPRVTLSDGSAEQLVFTSPSDLAAETELGFTLRVTDPGGLYAEDTVTVTVTLVSEVSIAAAADYPAEGADAVFRLTRAGSALKSLTIPVTVEETGAMLGTPVPAGATFAAGVREAELRVPTLADAVLENDSRVTVRLGSGPGWQLAPGAASASLTVLDDDVAPSVSAADVTIWSADMTVVEYGPRSIGAGSAGQFSNQMGRAGLRAKWLWYDPVTRKLKLGFDDSLDDAELLTLHMGGVSLGFPDRTGGNSSFSLENVDISWTDGETLAVRVSKPSAETVSTDATLASLTVAGATLSPAFDARVLLYWTVADAGAETVSVSAQANDDGATVAYGPSADANAELADHQVAAPTGGEILVVVTVTAADGTVRRYRVVVAPTAAGSNTAPTGAPTISGTPQVGETLTADTSAINDEDGLENVAYRYQWISSKTVIDDVTGTSNILTSDVPGATNSTYTLAPADEGFTFQVKVSFTDDADYVQSLTSEATVTVAPPPNTEPTGLPAVTGTPQVGETLAADTSSIDDADGLTNVSYRYQWLAGESDLSGATGSSYTLTASELGKTVQVRVSFSDDRANEESLTSAGTSAVTRPPPRAPEMDEIFIHDGMLRVTGARLQLSSSTPPEMVPLADVGSYISSFKVQWKSGSQDYDATRQAVVAPEPVTANVAYSAYMPSYDITGLTNGVEYTVRVIATNAGGDGPPSQEQPATPNPKPEELWQYIEDEIVEEHEASYPWLRQVWNYLQNNNIPLYVSTSENSDGRIDTDLKEDDSGVNGRFVHSWTVSESTVDEAEATKKDSLLHSLAYMYTTTNGVSSNPAPLGIASVYFRNVDTLSLTCWDTKLFLDVVVSLALHDSLTGASDWKWCMERSEDATVLEVVRSALSGQMPAWFADTYHDSEGNPDLEQLWSDVKTTRSEVVAYQLRNSFGGYCDSVSGVDMSRAIRGVIASLDPLVNPWRDGGCVPGVPTSLSASPLGDGTATVSWEAPASNGSTLLWGYKIEWQSVGAGDDATPGEKQVNFEQWSNEARPREVSETIDGLTDGVAYTVRVLAYNGSGDGPAAEVVVAAKSNSPATGAPTISGTAQVDETLAADTSGIADSDGLANVSYSYQWIRSDNGADTDIAGETDSTYTLVLVDLGKTIKVQVSFTDDADNDETLTSEATVAVAATVPSAPQSLTVTSGSQIQELDVSWQAPSANGGSGVTGYKVQWKESADSWDTETDISEATETGTTHTVTGLTGGVEYAVRVIATNDVGDGPASTEAKGTPAGGVSEQTVDPENTAPTGLPAISGNPQVDQTLTADTSAISDADGLTNVSYRYQWIADGTDIEGATGSSYELTSSEHGQTIQVQVSFTDDAGNEETLTSAATATVAARPNSPATGLPTISGTAQVDLTLTADVSSIADSDGLTNVSYSYQWIRNDGTNDSDIGGQTGSTYTLVSADEGKTIKVRVSFTDDAGNEETLTSAATAAVAAAPSRLTVSLENAATTHDGSAVFTFEIRFSEEFALSYTTLKFHAFDVTGGEVLKAQRMDKPSNIRWLITVGPDVNGDVTVVLPVTEDCAAQGAICTEDGRPLSNRLDMTVTGPLSADQNTEATGAPTISGTAQVGETLTADVSSINDSDGLTNVSYSYQWIANDGTNDADIGGQTGSTYTLTDEDMGKTIKVRVSFTDDAGNEETLTSAATAAVASRPNTPATGLPTISGTVQVDQTLTADVSSINDADGLTNVSYSYQWIRNDGGTDADIAGETASTHTLVSADEGKTIKVRVSFTDAAGNEETLTSAATAAVASRPNTPATGLPTISGTVQVDETLTADTSGISDADGLTNVSYSYQWIRNDGTNDSDMGGQTGSTYTLVSADEGKAIKVRVSFTDDAGNEETLTSAATAAVASRPNTPATGLPAISGTAQVDETLTADTSGITDSDGLTNVSYSYQWIRNDGTNDADIGGQTGSTYTLTDEDEGMTIKVRVSFTDDAGNEETLTSAATAAVASRPNTPATGLPTISGTVQVDETLTANISGIADEDGLDNAEFSYQWLANDADIQNATDSTYTLTDDDVGKTIKVRVSFTDDRSNDETLTSAATDTVVAKPDSPDTDAPPRDPGATVDVTVGNTVTGEIEEAIEVDWFKVSLLASETYQIDMRGAWGGEWARIDGEIVWVAPGTLHDPKLLGVFSAANVLVPGTDEEVSGDDRGDYEEGKNSRITSFSPPADGYYYIAAAAEAAWTGTYELTVTVVADE